jgi:hypothetical protein
MLATPVAVPWWGGVQLTVEFPDRHQIA